MSIRVAMIAGLLAVTPLLHADVLDDALLQIGATRASLSVDTDVRERDAFRLDTIDQLMAEPLDMPEWTHGAASEIAGATSLQEIMRNKALSNMAAFDLITIQYYKNPAYFFRIKIRIGTPVYEKFFRIWFSR